MEDLLKRFGRPWILEEYHAYKGDNCWACNKSIRTGDSVYCIDDMFFMHKTCVELPQELEHPMHHDHRLILKAFPGYFICNVCGFDGPKKYTYLCLSCGFYLCLTCVLQDRSFHHNAHNHPLTLMPREALFRCAACNAEAKDLSYFCTTCLFWIHQSCASAPTTLKCEFHKDHPLVLAYSLPEQYRSFDQPCSICKKKVHKSFWLYYCADCRFVAHIKCATSPETVEPSRSGVNKNTYEVDELNLVHFPMPDETSLSSLINQFVKDLSLADVSSRPADQISHWAHKDHPLVLCDELNQSNTEKKYDEMLCDGCVRPLSVDTFYGCVQCNYFLHRVCAELPDELEHPSHPEHKLLMKQSSNPCEFIRCSFCKRCCNGIFFNCKSCKFYIDIVCASLPIKIKHESHEHPLNQLQISKCTASNHTYPGFGFGCETCGFYLSKSRAIMPRTIRHRWDPHPLVLVYPPVKGHPHEFDCEMCSVDIDPNYWFYHCSHCDLSFHMRCLGYDDIWSNTKFGATIKVDYHQHSLTFVKNKRKRTVCSIHTDDINVGEPALECAPCKYLSCLACFPYL